MSTAIMQSGAFYDFGDLLLKVSQYFSLIIIYHIGQYFFRSWSSCDYHFFIIISVTTSNHFYYEIQLILCGKP